MTNQSFVWQYSTAWYNLEADQAPARKNVHITGWFYKNLGRSQWAFFHRDDSLIRDSYDSYCFVYLLAPPRDYNIYHVYQADRSHDKPEAQAAQDIYTFASEFIILHHITVPWKSIITASGYTYIMTGTVCHCLRICAMSVGFVILKIQPLSNSCTGSLLEKETPNGVGGCLHLTFSHRWPDPPDIVFL